MPYIDFNKRACFKTFTDSMDRLHLLDSGCLNYIITKLTHAYIRQHGVKYQAINDVVGALEGAKLELYRRVASPYEDKKALENGDVALEVEK